MKYGNHERADDPVVIGDTDVLATQNGVLGTTVEFSVRSGYSTEWHGSDEYLRLIVTPNFPDGARSGRGSRCSVDP